MTTQSEETHSVASLQAVMKEGRTALSLGEPRALPWTRHCAEWVIDIIIPSPDIGWVFVSEEKKQRHLAGCVESLVNVSLNHRG